jgi:hypothetical protein
MSHTSVTVRLFHPLDPHREVARIGRTTVLHVDV